METNFLATAAALSDRELLARLDALAGKEREASVELVAHLAALDSRPAVYAAQGYGSLFSYCTQALRLSEDAACNRIAAARASRAFPVVLDLLASGSLSLTSVRLLGRLLTPENCEAVLAKAMGRSRREIEALVAAFAPRPDVPTSVRRLPTPTVAPTLTPCPPAMPVPAATSVPSKPAPAIAPPPAVFVATSRPIIQATAPKRYRVQFTIGEDTHEKLRRVQSLLRREIPSGDPGAIFDRALALLLEKVEKTKLAATSKPRPGGSIRPGTDKVHKSTRPSRHIPREVKRAVWRRDGGQCAFVAPIGRRCTERTYLDFHHVQAYARQGPATVENISLRCWRHNHYEADLIFGPHGASIVREGSVVEKEMLSGAALLPRAAGISAAWDPASDIGTSSRLARFCRMRRQAVQRAELLPPERCLDHPERRDHPSAWGQVGSSRVQDPQGDLVPDVSTVFPAKSLDAPHEVEASDASTRRVNRGANSARGRRLGSSAIGRASDHSADGQSDRCVSRRVMPLARFSGSKSSFSAPVRGRPQPA